MGLYEDMQAERKAFNDVFALIAEIEKGIHMLPPAQAKIEYVAETMVCDCCKVSTNNWQVHPRGMANRNLIVCTRCSIKECTWIYQLCK